MTWVGGFTESFTGKVTKYCREGREVKEGPTYVNSWHVQRTLERSVWLRCALGGGGILLGTASGLLAFQSPGSRNLRERIYQIERPSKSRDGRGNPSRY